MAVSGFYGFIFIISLVLTAGYVFMWHKHFDVNFTMIFTLVPISCLGYLLRSLAKTPEGIITATQITYIGGCFLQLFICLSIFNLCKIELPRWLKSALYAVCSVVFVSSLTIGYTKIFYKDYSFAIINNTPVMTKTYGFMHHVFIALVVIFFVVGIVTIIYSWLYRKQAARRILMYLVVPDVICVAAFFIGRYTGSIDMVPVGYIFAQIMYLIISFRVILYDVSDTVIDSVVQSGELGYVSFDFENRYLGSNDVADRLIPELKIIAVDERIGYRPSERKIRHYIESFKLNEDNNTFKLTYKSEDEKKVYIVSVNYLYDGTRRRGYIITFNDDTENQRYISLIDKFNEELKDEVDKKTKHIVLMHDNLIMSLAMMVESRDNSTGGHIKRTSEGVRILIDEILKEGKLKLTPDFCRCVIKAAPMHDLGKIAVDDAVLRKPGRFEPEEFEMMKKHAAEGARVIHEILLNTDDEEFKVIAENVAHYHHERYDGSGYPEGLKGEDIPIEARIMAIADVYDALVSKRVYKEAFDFEKADSIIMEGMGTQFDPDLKTAYEKARPRLEEYYGAL